jgi:hypothetical protein
MASRPSGAFPICRQKSADLRRRQQTEELRRIAVGRVVHRLKLRRSTPCSRRPPEDARRARPRKVQRGAGSGGTDDLGCGLRTFPANRTTDERGGEVHNTHDRSRCGSASIPQRLDAKAAQCHTGPALSTSRVRCLRWLRHCSAFTLTALAGPELRNQRFRHRGGQPISAGTDSGTAKSEPR